MSNGRRAPVRRARSGLVPLAVAMAVSLVIVVLLGPSPTLNPLDLLVGNAFDVSVPVVSGMTQTKALVKLTDGHLRGRVTFAHSNSVVRGLVVQSRPAESDTVGRGTVIQLIVSRGPDTVVVPDVSTLAEVDAQLRLDRLGLNSRIERVNDENAAKGTVFHQKPLPGEVAGGSSTVVLTVSLGPAARAVPDVAKITLEGALFSLGRAGFTLGTVTEQDDPQLPADAVIRTEPAAGEIRDRDTPVNIVVSLGPAPVTVPSVVTKTYDEAAATLSGSGLVAAVKTATVPAGDPTIGTVTAQTPAGGAGLRPGQVVTLTIAQSG